MKGSLNSTFITLIPKKDSLDTFYDFRPISLCNLVYKMVTKVIVDGEETYDFRDYFKRTIWILRK